MNKLNEVLKEIDGKVYAVNNSGNLVAKEILSAIIEDLQEQINTMDSFYDHGYYVGNIEFVKELPTKGEMIEARINALNIIIKELSEARDKI